MFEAVTQIAPGPPPLLGPDDPPVFEAVNPSGSASILLICDHASRAVPRSLANLGLDAAATERHIAWDIGAAEVTRLLSKRLDAPALLAGYSRLVIDLNRHPGHPGSIPEISDGTVVPGNRDLTAAARAERVDTFFWPYHQAITDALSWRCWSGRPPALFSIHSFTPTMNGQARPWDVSTLWKRDPRLAVPILEALSAEGDLVVGDNQPYSGRDVAYTVDLHATAAGLPAMGLEIRQDRVTTPEDVARWARILGDALSDILSQGDVLKAEFY
jgi:predicted N-formylglutamate amidohydrolase